MTYPESLPRIRGNKRKFQPGTKAKGTPNHHPMNLSRSQLHLHTSLKGKQKYLINLATYMVMSIPQKFFGTMTSSPSYLTRSSEFKSVFHGESPNITALEHHRSLTIY
jgi:hypothetical protein